jgi:hypothetical protein
LSESKKKFPRRDLAFRGEGVSTNPPERVSLCSSRKKRRTTYNQRLWRNSSSGDGGGTICSRCTTRRFIFIALSQGGPSTAQWLAGGDLVWVFDKSDETAYYLGGVVKIKPTSDAGLWSGTLDLPKAKLPIEPE